MCGICGELRFDGAPASRAAVERMSGVLMSRGPDGSGTHARGRLAVAHRRLAVIDPSPRARQPMLAPELRLGIVYNGAVYNHRELRQELEGLGYRFLTKSDTEVLLKAYRAWGCRFVERLNGMFAFALWETDSGRVVLGRDRLGIKPLYTAAIQGGLRFASSLPALLAAGGVDTDLDPVAVHHYLTLSSAIPAPRTLLKGVRKLPPATLLKIKPDGSVESRCYWRLDFSQGFDPAADESTSPAATLGTLRRAVKRRLVADVPVGVLLSGGLDSSLIVALMTEFGGRPVRTFSIGFHHVGGLRGNEFHYSDLIARRFGAEHHKFLIGPMELLEHLEGCIRAMSEPQANHDAIGFYLLARMIKRDVRVVLTGQGADELFAGYSWHSKIQATSGGAETCLRVVFDRDHARVFEALHPRLAGDDHSLPWLEEQLDASRGDPLARLLHCETTTLLGEDPLKRVDDMSMAWGLEARTPFLDHELVELAARIPSALKVGDGGKLILKQAARKLLPPAIINQPKGYFPVPSIECLRGSCLAFARDVLTQRRARARCLFRQEYIDTLLAAPAARRDSKRLWEAAILEAWLQVHAR